MEIPSGDGSEVGMVRRVRDRQAPQHRQPRVDTRELIEGEERVHGVERAADDGLLRRVDASDQQIRPSHAGKEGLRVSLCRADEDHAAAAHGIAERLVERPDGQCPLGHGVRPGAHQRRYLAEALTDDALRPNPRVGEDAREDDGRGVRGKLRHAGSQPHPLFGEQHGAHRVKTVLAHV